MNGYTSLALAIVAEVIATSALQASAGFTRLWPLVLVVLVVLGYGVAFHCLSPTLRTVPVGVACALWSGLGIVLITSRWLGAVPAARGRRRTAGHGADHGRRGGDPAVFQNHGALIGMALWL